MSSPHLIAKLADGRRMVFAIDKPSMIVGRAPSCDIALPEEKKLSRRHLQITLVDGVLWAEDLGSANGTRFRKQKIDKRMMLEGDVLRVGPLALQFSYRDFGEEAPPADEDEDTVVVASGSDNARPATSAAPPPPTVPAPPAVPLASGTEMESLDPDDATPPAASALLPSMRPPSGIAAPPPPRVSEAQLPAAVPPPSTTARPPQKDEMVGTVLAGYMLEALIGRGGMGSVYRARHQVMDTVVAVKMIRGEVDEDARKRFFREARAAFALAHPNVVRVLHADLAPDGHPFLVMDYVDGVSMKYYVPKGGMPDEVVAQQLVQICAGLAAAHKAGIVHRDIKPDNVLVEAGTLRPRITDFGLTKMVDTDTVSTGLFGTPIYMPPEQWDDHATVDPRADIYALGVTGYFMLSRAIPYPTRDAPTIMRHVMRRQRIAIQQAVPGIDPGLAGIIEAMMEWDIERRYQTVTDVQADLTDWMRASP